MQNWLAILINRLLGWSDQRPGLLAMPTSRLAGSVLIIMAAVMLSGCSALMSKATGGMAANLSAAILDQEDPETVRDGVPAYLLMLDSFVAGAPEDVGMLSAAAELYAAYGVVFVDDPERAKRLTRRSWQYGRRAICAANPATCGMEDLHLQDLQPILAELTAEVSAPLYSFGLSWLAYIQTRTDDAAALARLPQATAVMQRTRALDPDFRPGQVESYLAVLCTIRPPALGGDFAAGREHYENAIALSGGRDLSVQVKFARYYARTLYDRDLHDQVLEAVLASDPVEPGLTLTNTLAQREARILLDSADEHF